VKIRLEPTGDGGVAYPTVEISTPRNSLDVGEVWDNLIRPALLAWGYQPENLDELVDK